MTSREKDDGGAAFPTPSRLMDNGGVESGNYGMSLRDWFAGQVVIGFMSNPAPGRQRDAASIASVSYEVADALLASRQEKNNEG